jgi:hypothetical protein
MDRGLSKAKSDVTSWVSGVSAVASQIAPLGGALLALEGINALKASILGAADLGETMSKVDVVFGKSSQVVSAFADEMAAKFGANKQVMLDAAASIGLVGKAAGLSQADAAGMSTSLARLADDASSFYNVPLEEALLTIKSALVGEAEPIRKFGVLLNEDAVKAEAFRLGIVKAGGALTEQAKVMARVSLIQKGMTDATGDHARTMDSFTNKLREVWGRVQNIGVTIGTALLPIATAVINVLGGIVQAIEWVIKKLQEYAAWWQGTGEAAEDAGKKMAVAAKPATIKQPTTAEQAKAIDDKAQASVSGAKESEAVKQRVAAIQEDQRLEAAKEKGRQTDLVILKARRLDMFIIKEKGPDGKVREVVGEAFKDQVAKIREKYATPEGLVSAGKDRIGQVLGAIAQLKGDAIGGAAIAAKMVLGSGGEKVKALTGVTDFDSYRRSAQDSILAGKDGDTQKQQLDENKKQVSELKAIKDQLIKQARGVVQAAYG